MEREILDDLEVTSKPKADLIGAGGVLATGIISIPFFAGLIGLILAIVTLSRAKQALRVYNESPNSYTESSFKKVRAGKVCAIVSLSLSGLALLIFLAITSTN
jgi:hypothetical protein